MNSWRGYLIAAVVGVVFAATVDILAAAIGYPPIGGYVVTSDCLYGLHRGSGGGAGPQPRQAAHDQVHRLGHLLRARCDRRSEKRAVHHPVRRIGTGTSLFRSPFARLPTRLRAGAALMSRGASFRQAASRR